MNKTTKFLVIALTALLFISCNHNIDPKGNITVRLPGRDNSRKAIEVEKSYTQNDADFYAIFVESKTAEYSDRREGFPGDTISFDKLEAGEYIVNAYAYSYKKASTDSVTAVTEQILIAEAEPAVVQVELGKVTPVTLKMIPEKYIDIIDDGEPENPEITEPKITDIIITLNEDRFSDYDFLPYDFAREILFAESNGKDSMAKELFKVSFIFDDDEETKTEPVSLFCTEQISVFMPYEKIETTGERKPYVGPVPFSFSLNFLEDNKIEVFDQEAQEYRTYQVCENISLDELEVIIKYPATAPFYPGNPYENTVLIPAITGSTTINLLDEYYFYDEPVVYHLYDGTAVSDKLVLTREYPSSQTIFFNTKMEEEGDSYIEVIPAPGINRESEATVTQACSMEPGIYAYYENEDILYCAESINIKVIPYTLSEFYDYAKQDLTSGPLEEGTYSIELLNEAGFDFENYSIIWENSDDTNEILFEPYIGMSNFYLFDVKKADGKKYTIKCEIIDENKQVLLTLSKEITLSLSKEANISKLDARLKVTEKNKEYVFVSDEESYALCTGSNNENNGKTGQILTPDDFEFYTTDANGREKIFEIDNSNNGYRVEIANNNWGAIGKDIPVTITRSYPEEKNYTTVTLKRYSKEASVSLIDGSDCKYSFIVNATDGYPVYSEKENDITRNIDYITLDIKLLNTDNKSEKTISIASNKDSEFLNKESSSLEENNTAFNKLDVLIDFADLGLTPGDYILNVTAQSFITDYEGLFLPSTVSEIKISIPEKTDDGSNTEDKIQTIN